MKGTLTIHREIPLTYPNTVLTTHTNLDGKEAHIFEAEGKVVLEMRTDHSKVAFQGQQVRFLGMTVMYRDGYMGPVQEYVDVTLTVK